MGDLPTMVERLLSLELILDNFLIWPTEIENKYPRHWVFPDGPPSKYYLGPTMLNFRDLTRTGVFIEVWSYTAVSALYLYLRCTNRLRSLIISLIGVGSNPTTD